MGPVARLASEKSLTMSRTRCIGGGAHEASRLEAFARGPLLLSAYPCTGPNLVMLMLPNDKSALVESVPRV